MSLFSFCPSPKADDYTPFSAVWDQPEGGIHGYLVRFLESRDTTFQHIAIWTLVQLLESGGSSLAYFCDRRQKSNENTFSFLNPHRSNT